MPDMSPSDCAWLHAPGSEQTLRLPVNHRFSNRNDLCRLVTAIYTVALGVLRPLQNLWVQRYFFYS